MPAGKHRRVLTILAVLAVAAICGAIAWAIRQAWPGSASKQPYEGLVWEQAGSVAADAALESRIRAFCGDCHAVPRPESFPRDVWQTEVEKGEKYYLDSGRTDLDPPPMAQTVAFFRSRAPEAVAYEEPHDADTPLRVTFQQERLDGEPDVKIPPGIAGLCWTALGPKQPPVLVASDMLSGAVTSHDLGGPKPKSRLLAQLNNPCHIEPCDLDGDGALDLLVADLGSRIARDHNLGRVIWLRQDGRTGRFEEVVLASGLGRVADVRPIALDSSGTLHLVAAEFGWSLTGGVLLLKNIASPGEQPRFESEVLDPRAGTVHVPVCDLNRDGRPDFLALVSNESESVEAFLNQGGGKFHRQTLWQAPDLTFGSSGIQLVDLDGDGDLDVLYANGDAFDNMRFSPWHGVQWLENRGAVQFVYHRIADMFGAEVVQAGDFDGDGDMDILLAAFVPPRLTPDWLVALPLPSVVLLEQTSPGRFARHTLERGFPCHAAVVAGDFNGDGRLDFAVGNHAGGHHFDALGRSWLSVWWNRGSPKGRR